MSDLGVLVLVVVGLLAAIAAGVILLVSETLPRWLVLAVLAVMLVLVGGNLWWSENPPGGSGPWAFLTVVGAFIGVAAAVNLGVVLVHGGRDGR